MTKTAVYHKRERRDRRSKRKYRTMERMTDEMTNGFNWRSQRVRESELHHVTIYQRGGKRGKGKPIKVIRRRGGRLSASVALVSVVS